MPSSVTASLCNPGRHSKLLAASRPGAMRRRAWCGTAGCLSSPEQCALQLGWDCALDEVSTQPIVVLVAQAAVEAEQPLELLRCS